MTSTSYASATKKDFFPSPNQAIILPYVQGAPIFLYARKMLEIIGDNILHCAKISNNRVRMYLKTREIAENFITSGGEIEINRQVIKARWYRSEKNDKKIIISNIPPHVPHETIIKQMATHGVPTTSVMKFLRFYNEEGVTNILSERRFMYIPIEVAEKLPTSEVITYDGEEYRAFYNDAQVKCFICHQVGHTTAACEFSYENNKPRNEKNNPVDESNLDDKKEHDKNKFEETSRKNIDDQDPITSTISITEITENLKPQTEEDLIKLRQGMSNKRALSNYSDTSQSTSTQSTFTKDSHQKLIQNSPKNVLPENLNQNDTNTSTQKKFKQKTKKLKVEENPLSIKEQLKPIQENYQKHEKEYPISFSNFQLMMDMVKGQRDPFSTITQFTNDIEGVSKILEENYPLLKSRTMKTRFTKLRKKIITTQDEENSSKNEDSTDNLSENDETNKSYMDEDPQSNT